MRKFVQIVFWVLSLSLFLSSALFAQCEIEPKITTEYTPNGGKIYISVNQDLDQVTVKLFDLKLGKFTIEKKISFRANNESLLFDRVAKGRYVIEMITDQCEPLSVGGTTGIVIGN